MKKVLAVSAIVPLAVMLLSVGSAFACGTTACANGNVAFSSTNTQANTNTASVTNSNTANVTNTVTSNASTGGNTASGGTSQTSDTSTSHGAGTNTFTDANANQGGVISTGNAVAESSVTNALNANITSTAAPSFPANTADDTAAVAGFFGLNTAGNTRTNTFTDDISNTNSNSATIANTNNATLANTVTTYASTGGNTASGGTSNDTFSATNCGCDPSGTTATDGNSNLGGGIITGNDLASSSIANYLNLNITRIR